jgi:hypothetical protein
MTHILYRDRTLCGRTLNDLAKIDPMGATVMLATPMYLGEDALAVRRRFDTIADQASCNECRRVYVIGKQQENAA